MTIKVFCDFCDKEIDKEHFVAKVKDDDFFSRIDDYKLVDICENCHNYLLKKTPEMEEKE